MAARMAMTPTTIISSINENPAARPESPWRGMTRLLCIQQLPPGHAPDVGRPRAGLDLRITAVVQARVHVLAEEDRVVRAAVVGHAGIRRIRVATVVITVIANGSIPVGIEERVGQPTAGEGIDRHGEAL